MPTWLVELWANWHTPIVITLILIGGVLVRLILLAVVRRVVRTVVDGVNDQSSPLAKARVAQRTSTIGSVLSNFITWGLSIVVISAILSELGIAVGAIIGGVGILGAALGFGAQSLVRDLISGLFIVAEDQYGVGDTVDLGEAKGAVEAVGLRVTQIRDVEGTLWYVRNGEIVRVGNKSQGWARVVLDIAFEYGVDVTKATAAVEKAAGSIDPTHLTGKAEVWGIQDVTGDSFVLRLVQQVQPKSQDAVARELRAAIKASLDKSRIKLAGGAGIYVVPGK